MKGESRPGGRLAETPPDVKRKASTRGRLCSKGHPEDRNHIDRVRLSLATTSEEWKEALALGYVSDRRCWDGRERRRSA